MRYPLVFLLLAASGCAPGARTPTAAIDCALVGANRAWVAGLLEAWAVASEEVLHRGNDFLPWIVVYDTECAWHVRPDPGRLAELGLEARPVPAGLRFAGNDLPVMTLPHHGSVGLPNGTEIPAAPYAAASLHSGDSTFFTLAIGEVWTDVMGPDSGIESPQRFFRGVALHEIVHTLQLPTLRARVRTLGETAELPQGLDDDFLERNFSGDSSYVVLFRQERDLFHRAARTADRARKIELVRQGLAVAEERRRRFFTGEHAVFAPLEGLFLNMEGIAVWTHARLHDLRPDLVDFEASGNTSWSQDEGWALMQLVNQLVPGWLERILGPEMASPFILLEEAVR